jgi:hypothetical protein
VDNADPPQVENSETAGAKAWQVGDLKKFLAATKEERLYPLGSRWRSPGYAAARRWDSSGKTST